MNKPNGKTFALYRSIKTGQDCRMDITDVYNTMIDEVGKDVMSAGIVTSIISLATNNDGQAFYYGSAEDCMDYLINDVNDRIINPNRYKQSIKKTDEDKTEADYAADLKKKDLLRKFGWSEINTGGNCMVMFKDFLCVDGKVRMVGVDGEAEDGCLYPVPMSIYWGDQRTGDEDYDENTEGTDCTELLHQFQKDEILYANSLYDDYTAAACR